MGLYEELLLSVTNTNSQLEDIFFKLKVLAARLRIKKFIKFINSELNGYNNIDNIPSYRKVNGVLKGTVENPICRRPNITLPIMHLEKYGLENIKICNFPNKISELEAFLDKDEVYYPINPEYYQILSESLDNGYVVTNAYIPISKAQIKGILTSIRSTVLDLLMSMEEDFSQTELDILFQCPTKEQKNKVEPIINQFFISSFGNSVQNTKIELENGK